LAHFKLRPRKENPKKNDPRIERGLALYLGYPSIIWKKYYMYITKNKAKKEVHEGKCMTIKGALRSGCASNMVKP
jgi:hypothetical protein